METVAGQGVLLLQASCDAGISWTTLKKLRPPHQQSVLVSCPQPLSLFITVLLLLSSATIFTPTITVLILLT